MSYTPTEWESTDVVTATRLNALEQAVGDLNMSYTPNVWQNGDILTADKMNALEQAVASGGGGGDSDFTTATMTITNNSMTDVRPLMPFVIDEDGFESSAAQGYAEMSTVTTFRVILYKGTALICITELGVSISTTGNIEDDGDGYYYVTGDCTITIT